ncbi:hypothetical protein PALU110988_18750 [Paenibacillus lupini]|uniref:hypothetical protein n=1 Tax=Paenibacillus lupini TaxID=1450204 RepID=UPI0014223726|nr:hypothetical protein [Paenibacillus lupini]NIK24229.1 DNA/RNA endonuclease YhcR with UshA esterase domain [Paenibacillus lupini]
MVEEALVIQSVTVYKGATEKTYSVGEEVNGAVVIEIVDKKTIGTIEFDLLDEDGQVILKLEKLPCLVEWMKIAVDGPVSEVQA